MNGFWLKKVVSMVATLFLVVTLTFFLMKAVPGDPFSDEKALPKEIHETLLRLYGLNEPWDVQYLHYLKSILTWNLGPSIKFRDRTVNQIIYETFPISAILGLGALTLAVGGGILIGLCAAVRHQRWQDNGIMALATLGISMPSFLIATLLQYVLAIKLGWLPVARWGTSLQMILPTLSLAAMPMAYIARLVRTNLLEVFQEEYIKTAKSKGLPKGLIIWRHCLRNALTPLLPYFGQLSANILVGSFVIEKIFGIPGLGHWFISSVHNRDYTVIMGTTIFYSFILLGMLLITDIIHKFLNPNSFE